MVLASVQQTDVNQYKNYDIHFSSVHELMQNSLNLLNPVRQTDLRK